MAAPKKYPDDLRARAVRLYRESQPKPVIKRLAEQLGVHQYQRGERNLRFSDRTPIPPPSQHQYPTLARIDGTPTTESAAIRYV